MDQILNDDLGTDERINSLENQEMDEYQPGLAQFYCLPCAHYYESQHALDAHRKSKVHKRRLKQLKNPYTKEEADMAAGKNIDKWMKKVDTQRNIHSRTTVQALMAIKKDLAKIEPMDVDRDAENALEEDVEIS